MAEEKAMSKEWIDRQKMVTAREWMDRQIALWHEAHTNHRLGFDGSDSWVVGICGMNFEHEIHISVKDDNVSSFVEFARLLGVNTITFEPNRFNSYKHMLVSFMYKGFTVFTLLERKEG